MKKTLAQLKMDAKTGRLFVKMIIRNGSTNIPEVLQGGRQVVDYVGDSLIILNNDDRRSTLKIESAKLIEYTDSHITLYNPGLRDLTQEEIDIMNLTSEIDSFWDKKRAFIELGYIYLLGNKVERGLRYDYNTNKVYDNKVKGDISIKYEIISQ